MPEFSTPTFVADPATRVTIEYLLHHQKMMEEKKTSSDTFRDAFWAVLIPPMMYINLVLCMCM